MTVRGSWRLSVEHCRSNSTLSPSAPGVWASRKHSGNSREQVKDTVQQARRVRPKPQLGAGKEPTPKSQPKPDQFPHHLPMDGLMGWKTTHLATPFWLFSHLQASSHVAILSSEQAYSTLWSLEEVVRVILNDPLSLWVTDWVPRLALWEVQQSLRGERSLVGGP